MSEEQTPATLLCVDDEPSILASLRRLFRPHGYRIFVAEGGAQGLELLEKETVDLVISDMRMPQMDGAQFLEKVRERWPRTIRILLTGYADVTSTIAAINRGEIYRYISKPWDDNDIVLIVRQALERQKLEQENARLLDLTRRQNDELKDLNTSLESKVVERTAELRKANADLHRSFLATVQVFSSLIELREGKLAGHSRRVADLARQLGERLGLDEAEQRNILLAGLLHDIGKVGLPDNLLDRPFNALSATEKIEVMRHPLKGQQLLLGIPQLAEVGRIIRHHHECMDGSGYPDRIGGLLIPLGARILAVANDYDALLAGSLALLPHSPKQALTFIYLQRGKRYDPTAVDAFVAMMEENEMQRATEMVLPPDKLSPGMILARDLNHRDGDLLLPKGRVLDAGAIAQLRSQQEVESEPILLHVFPRSAPAVLRDQSAQRPQRLYKELALPSGHLREGMVLSRNLYHHDGYLLLAGGNRLDALIIKQIREIEKAGDKVFTVYVRVEDKAAS